VFIAGLAAGVFTIAYLVIVLITRGIGWSWDLALGTTILAVLMASAIGALVSVGGESEADAAATIS
jgi:hypothetical protein